MMKMPIEEKTITRRSFLKNIAKFCFAAIAAGAGIGTYSFKLERFWYQISEVQLKVRNLPKAFVGWKIVQFSDVHLGFHYENSDFNKVIQMINGLNPDMIFFTGDLIQIGNNNPERAMPLLQALKTPRGGKWGVIGNHDFYLRNRVTHVLQSGQFKMLNNSHDMIESNGQRLYIAGIDDVMYGFPNVTKAAQGLTNDDCVLLLAHEPDIADESSHHPICAQFSGHSHGGQVRLPFYGPIIKQDLAKKYVEGLYHVGDRKMPLYVNRGIGTTELPLRFLCRPEITVFRLM